MSHYPEAEAKLGKAATDLLFRYTRNGDISDQQMEDFVQRLGHPDHHDEANVLFGNHKKRMERDKNRDQSAELRDVLSDWWNEQLFEDEMTQQIALAKLVSIFQGDDIHLKPLAKALKDLKGKHTICYGNLKQLKELTGDLLIN